VSGRGVEGFAAGLEGRGFPVTRDAGVVSWPVVVATGQLAGATVDVGVEEEELSRWPLTVPHWVHLPSSILFSRTNPQPSSRPRWTKHSRNFVNWGRDRDAVRAVLAHVQAVLEDAHE
jgi:hypothetical protein